MCFVFSGMAGALHSWELHSHHERQAYWNCKLLYQLTYRQTDYVSWLQLYLVKMCFGVFQWNAQNLLKLMCHCSGLQDKRFKGQLLTLKNHNYNGFCTLQGYKVITFCYYLNHKGLKTKQWLSYLCFVYKCIIMQFLLSNNHQTTFDLESIIY